MLQSLLSQAKSGQVPAFAGIPSEQPKGIMLLEQIVLGTHYAALNTAVVGSGLNALASHRRLARPLVLRNYLPHAPSARLSWGQLMQQMKQPDTLAISVSAFFSHLADVEHHVEFVSTEIERHGQPSVGQQHATTIHTASTKMSNLGLAALDALDVVSHAIFSNYFTRNFVLLRGLLSEVKVGRMPLVDRSGDLVVPELPQKRSSPRRGVRLPCVVESKGQATAAVAVSICASNICIDHASPLAAKSVVVLELGERCFAGRVVWASHNSAAIKFDKPLKDDDPLIVP